MDESPQWNGKGLVVDPRSFYTYMYNKTVFTKFVS